MWLEQAVFTSSKTNRGEGYQVVAKSPGVSDHLVVALTRWCPSHASLQSDDVNAESTNYHPLSLDMVAISRTMYGLKEFSGRGGLQVVTIAILLRRSQLAGYENNCIRLARVARSLGHLRWRTHFPEQIAPIELPNREWSEALLDQELAESDGRSSPTQANGPSPARAAELLQAGQRVALLTDSNPNQVAEDVIQNIPIEDRPSCYFTTGLKWSKQRPFRLQLLDGIDHQLSIRLKSHNVCVADAKHEAASKLHF